MGALQSGHNHFVVEGVSKLQWYTRSQVFNVNALLSSRIAWQTPSQVLLCYALKEHVLNNNPVSLRLKGAATSDRRGVFSSACLRWDLQFRRKCCASKSIPVTPMAEVSVIPGLVRRRAGVIGLGCGRDGATILEHVESTKATQL